MSYMSSTNKITSFTSSNFTSKVDYLARLKTFPTKPINDSYKVSLVGNYINMILDKETGNLPVSLSNTTTISNDRTITDIRKDKLYDMAVVSRVLYAIKKNPIQPSDSLHKNFMTYRLEKLLIEKKKKLNDEIMVLYV